jgi:hypothetical protein
MPEFQDVDVPRGRFIGWGKVGQTITVKVASYDPTGGSDANGKVCPQMVGTLTEAADNYRDRGTTLEQLDAGELVTVTAGIANLKAGLLAADPKPGDLVRMEFIDTYKTANGTGKSIKIQIARGAANAVSADDL